MNEPEEFVALVRDFPVSVDDEDARWLAYSIWSSKVTDHGGTPVSTEADITFMEYENMLWPDKALRILGMARRGPE